MRYLFAFLICLLPFIGPPAAHAYTQADFIPDDFKLFWHVPTRAHPGVPLDFRASYYEKDNSPVTWSKSGTWPTGADIDSLGRIIWTPVTGDIGSYTNLKIRVTRTADAAYEESPAFTMVVGTSDFYFVSTTGSDSNAGTITLPFLTIEKAMRMIGDTNGKTIYVRGGTYQEDYAWEVAGIYAPFRNINFTAADPLEIRGYPGEVALLDCNFQGHGFWVYNADYVVIDNIRVAKANRSERGGILTSAGSQFTIVKDTVVYDSAWSYTENVTGYYMNGVNVLFDRNVGYNNRDPAVDWSHNSSNFLMYVEDTSDVNAVNYVLNSKSWDSIAGFKIKHAGPQQLIMHNNISIDDAIGFNIGSEYSSIRYCVSYNSGKGIYFGISDPNDFTNESMLAEHNTVYNAGSTAFDIHKDYINSGAGVPIIRNNLFFNNLEAAGTGDFDDRMLSFWIDDTTTAVAAARTIEAASNLYYGVSQSNVVRIGNTNPGRLYTFTAYQSAKEASATWANPAFADAPAGNLNVTTGSPAYYSATPLDFAGAYKPGVTYGSISKTLLSDPTPTPTPTATPTPTPGGPAGVLNKQKQKAQRYRLRK